MVHEFRRAMIVAASALVGLATTSGALAAGFDQVYAQVSLAIDRDGTFVDTTSNDVAAGAEAACLAFKRADCGQFSMEVTRPT